MSRTRTGMSLLIALDFLLSRASQCRHEPAARAADLSVESELKGYGLEVCSLSTLLLHEPEDVVISTGGRWVGHFGTLTPFLR